jgi:hypothetical protein
MIWPTAERSYSLVPGGSECMESGISIKRLLTDSYLALILLSVLAQSPILQWKYFLFWILILVGISVSAALAAAPLKTLCLEVAWSQIFGITLAVGSFASTLSAHVNEWLSGLLEIWVHPYLILVEQMPRIPDVGWSMTYLAACCTPFVPIVGVAFVYSCVDIGLRLYARRSLYAE